MVLYKLNVGQPTAVALCQIGTKTATRKKEMDAVAWNVEKLLGDGGPACNTHMHRTTRVLSNNSTTES